MLGNQLNASQSCFCSDCNSSSRVLTCGVGNYSRNVWCLQGAVGKKQKNMQQKEEPLAHSNGVFTARLLKALIVTLSKLAGLIN